MVNSSISILLLPGGGVPKGGGGRKKTFPLSPILSGPNSQMLSYFQTVTPQCLLPYSENNYVAHHNPVVYYDPSGYSACNSPTNKNPLKKLKDLTENNSFYKKGGGSNLFYNKTF